MSDTFFSGAPHWRWLIILYFFVGGLAGGACFLAALLDWFGRPEDPPGVRAGDYVAAWGAILSGLPVTVDPGRRLRFWRLLLQSGHLPALRALFVASGASTGAAALMLLAPGRGATPRSLEWLSSFDSNALVVEPLVLVVFLVSLGSVNRVWVSVWGLLLLVGVVGFGILVPLGLHLKPARFGSLATRPVVNAAKLVLLGGFLLRLATILASEGIDRYRVAVGI